MFSIDVLSWVFGIEGRAMGGFGNLDSVVLLFEAGFQKLIWQLDFHKWWAGLSPGACLILWDVGPLRRDHSKLLWSTAV